ncbi:MAG: MATE family efflux transporter [Oscillospiraceae bacterium]
MNKENTQLGTEPIGKLLVKLATPAIAAQLINALYNVVDRMYIGRLEEVGTLALTGVGLTFPIIMIISAFSSLIGMGGAPRASIKMGEGNKNGAEKIMGNCFSALVIVSVLLTVVFTIFKRPLLMAFGASENTITYALQYIEIYIFGTIFVQITMGMNSFITAQGFATMSMLTTGIGAGLNIVLDPIFIFVFNMGVRGAAIATVISQAASAIWVMKFLMGNKTTLKMKKENLKIDWKILSPAIALGLAPFVMTSTESLVNIALNSNLQRLGGDAYVGAMTIIGSVMQIAMMPLHGMSQGAQPILSYNFGAKNPKRVRKTFRLLATISVSYSTFIWAAILIFPQVFIMIFTEDAAIIEVTKWTLKIFACGVFAMGAQIACQQTMVSMGQSKVTLFLALLRKVILLIPLVFILPALFGLGVKGVFLAEPISDIIATTVTIICFVLNFPKLMRQISD